LCRLIELPGSGGIRRGCGDGGAGRKLFLERKELPDGYAYRFAWESDILEQFVEWIPLERACCPFLRFSIEVEPGNAVWLRLTGSAEVKEFIRFEFQKLGL